MIPKISDAEWHVMKLLWQKSPRTANEMVDILKKTTQWNPQTIRTLINRLVQKKAAAFEKDGRSYLYSPTVSEDKYKQTERKSFLSKVYNGSLQPMLAAFLNDTELSEEEIDELENILKQKRTSK